VRMVFLWFFISGFNWGRDEDEVSTITSRYIEDGCDDAHVQSDLPIKMRFRPVI
jgi:hypothetical protein